MSAKSIMLLIGFAFIVIASHVLAEDEDWTAIGNVNNYDIIYTAEFSSNNGNPEFKIINVYKGIAGEYVKNFLKKEARSEFLRDGTYFFAMNYEFTLPMTMQKLNPDDKVEVIQNGDDKKIVVVHRKERSDAKP